MSLLTLIKLPLGLRIRCLGIYLRAIRALTYIQFLWASETTTALYPMLPVSLEVTGRIKNGKLIISVERAGCQSHKLKKKSALHNLITITSGWLKGNLWQHCILGNTGRNTKESQKALNIFKCLFYFTGCKYYTCSNIVNTRLLGNYA